MFLTVAENHRTFKLATFQGEGGVTEYIAVSREDLDADGQPVVLAEGTDRDAVVRQALARRSAQLSYVYVE